MADQVKNIMIGLFIIAATAIMVFMLLFLNPSVGNEGQFLRVRFADIDKVNIGTRVTYGGRPVGEVVEINIVPEEEGKRDVQEGVVFPYELKLLVDTFVNVYSSDEVSLRTSGLLGEKSVEITPLPKQPDQPFRLINKEIIYAHQTGSVEQTFKEFKEVADKFDVALDTMNDILKEARDTKLVTNISDTFANMRELSKSLNKPKEIDRVVQNVVDITDDGKAVVSDVREGKGTIGKLLSTEDLYLQLSSVLSKAETMMDDINHYGILFHTDKGWQRLRARRMNLMEKLRTPQEFRNYFNDEVNQINTSLSRVSMVLQKAQCVDPRCMALDPEFKKVYAELLRRVGELEEAVRMYNEQVMQGVVQRTELAEITDYCR